MSANGTAPAGARIEVRDITKRFGSVLAVDRLSFTVEPGRVTGFLGPNGAGKTTTLRMILGLVKPSGGDAIIGGQTYRELSQPQQSVGALLESTSFHPGRSGRDHLRVVAMSAGVPEARVDELLELVALTGDADRRAGGYSMGMRQRLGLAAALLGDPGVLVLDEPANGLDPEGMRWLRGLLRTLADRGRTIVISSHVLSEVEQTVDDVVIIARGRLVHASTLADLEASVGRTVYVVTPNREALRSTVADAGLSLAPADDASGDTDDETEAAAFIVSGTTPAELGRIAYRTGIELHELRRADLSLEETFLRLVSEPAEGGTSA